jgi:hypothetical protein
LSLDLAVLVAGTPSIFKYDIDYTKREREYKGDSTSVVKRRLIALIVFLSVAILVERYVTESFLSYSTWGWSRGRESWGAEPHTDIDAVVKATRLLHDDAIKMAQDEVTVLTMLGIHSTLHLYFCKHDRWMQCLSRDYNGVRRGDYLNP